MILNILGLSVAFAACMIILIQVRYDYTFNHGIPEAKEIYRAEIAPDGLSFMTLFSRPYSELIIGSSPLITDGTFGSPTPFEQVIETEQNGVKQRFKEPHMVVLENWPSFFSYDMAEGDVHALSQPRTVLLPESMARKIFGDEPATGKTVTLEDSWALSGGSYTVGGVYRDWPANSSLKNGVVLGIGDTEKGEWNNWSKICFVRLERNISPGEALAAYYTNDHPRMESDMFRTDKAQLRLTPFTELHFIKNVLYDTVEKSSRQTILVLLLIAFILVSIAAINYTNFSMALAPVRIKSINTQKVLGAEETMLRKSLMFETFSITLLSFILSIVIVRFFSISGWSSLLQAPISLGKELPIVLATSLVVFLIALIAGLYPAYYITSFSPALVLKGSFGLSPKGRKLRSGLIGIQYVASFVLITGAAFMYLQNQFMKRSLGYDKEQVIVASLNGTVLQNRDAFKNQLLSHAGIDKVSLTEDLLSGKDGFNRYTRKFRNDEDISYYRITVDPDFLDLFGIEVYEGRNFRESDLSNTTTQLIFNDRGRVEYNLEIGEKIYDSEIIGFARDIQYTSFRQESAPMAYQVRTPQSFDPSYAYVRTLPDVDLHEAIQYVHASLQEMDPGYPFEVIFFDEVLQGLYQNENKMSLLITLFSLIAILISLVGVFGLVIFESEYKVKEIGIKKVMGSTTAAILLQYNKSYMMIVFVCFLIATPIGYLMISNWLQNFVEKIPVTPFVFVLAFLVIALITIITVTFQNWKIANMNPVQSLKNE